MVWITICMSGNVLKFSLTSIDYGWRYQGPYKQKQYKYSYNKGQAFYQVHICDFDCLCRFDSEDDGYSANIEKKRKGKNREDWTKTGLHCSSINLKKVSNDDKLSIHTHRKNRFEWKVVTKAEDHSEFQYWCPRVQKTRNENPPTHSGNRSYQLTRASQSTRGWQIGRHWLAGNSYFLRERIFISCFSEPLGINIEILNGLLLW